jgi:hypothetical protein
MSWLRVNCTKNLSSGLLFDGNFQFFLFIASSVAVLDDFCPDPDPNFHIGYVRIRILAHNSFVQTFYITNFLPKLHLNIIYEIKVRKHVNFKK